MCDIDKKLKLLGKQVEEVDKGDKITCGCGKRLDRLEEFRCYYCLETYCADCAANHFGLTREEYKKLHPDEFPF